jgi:putative protease
MPKKKTKKSKPKKAVVKKKKAGKKPAVKKSVKKAVKKAAVKTKSKKTSARASKKTAVARANPPMPWRVPLPGETLAGVVDDYYSHISVITTTLQAPLKVGELIHVRGHTTDLTQAVASLQSDHAPLSEAAAGDGVGIKVQDKCRRGDYIYKAG